MFFALQLNDELKEELGRLERQIRKAVPYGITFTRLEQLHLTLRFIPEVKESQAAMLVAALREIASGIPPFTLTLDCCTSFPYHGPVKVVWSTVAAESAGPISTCHRSINDMVLAQGFEVEEKPYVPHITLGRVRRGMAEAPIRKALEGIKVYPVTQRVEAITLFQSDLTIRGAVHTEIHTEHFACQPCNVT